MILARNVLTGGTQISGAQRFNQWYANQWCANQMDLHSYDKENMLGEHFGVWKMYISQGKHFGEMQIRMIHMTSEIV